MWLKIKIFFLTILRKRILKTLELWDIKSEFWLYSCNSMFTSFNFEFTPRNFVFFLTSWNKKGNCNFLSHSFLTSTFSLTIVSLYLTNCGFLANLRGKKARILRKVQIVRYNLSCKGEKSELWKKNHNYLFYFCILRWKQASIILDPIDFHYMEKNIFFLLLCSIEEKQRHEDEQIIFLGEHPINIQITSCG